jgi:adenosylmethionine-8-amino-7-oxononanoate aminotransferase
MQLLGLQPDVACYAKLLTAGMLPMSVTLASEAVFEVFEGDSKAQALLHGHSYTAHPIGCQVSIVGPALNGSAHAWHRCLRGGIALEDTCHAKC